MRPEIRGNGGAGLSMALLVLVALGFAALMVWHWVEKLSDWWRGRRKR